MSEPRVLVVTNMFPTKADPAFGTFVGEQVASVRQLGLDVDVLFINPREGKGNYVWGPARLRRQLSMGAYDLIHAHYVFCGLIAATQRRLPIVLTHHGIEVLTGWTAPLSRLASRLAQLTIVTSSEMAAGMPGNVVVLPCGIDLDLFTPIAADAARKALGLPEERELVLFAGELRAEKRVEIAQTAIARLKGEGRKVDLVIAAGQPHERIPLYMSACDALVLVSDYEGSPMVIKEAMACGLPIVATNVGDIAEVMGDTVGCFLCRPDVDDVVEKLGAALAFGRRTDGRRRVMHLSQPRIAEQLVEHYREIVGRHGC